ncbi:hypothetical protein RF11_07256 [Thelohanellus kitauei]|uniref:Uncharacterized protein n=1 Tax=Thelohanellus kitauei TaxID=669202 RepID=A0A0C2MR22_THEKT|nr:hypothetical protein RF11_07256 [Thelohanellus kitauei]
MDDVSNRILKLRKFDDLSKFNEDIFNESLQLFQFIQSNVDMKEFLDTATNVVQELNQLTQMIISNVSRILDVSDDKTASNLLLYILGLFLVNIKICNALRNSKMDTHLSGIMSTMFKLSIQLCIKALDQFANSNSQFSLGAIINVISDVLMVPNYFDSFDVVVYAAILKSIDGFMEKKSLEIGPLVMIVFGSYFKFSEILMKVSNITTISQTMNAMNFIFVFISNKMVASTDENFTKFHELILITIKLVRVYCLCNIKESHILYKTLELVLSENYSTIQKNASEICKNIESFIEKIIASGFITPNELFDEVSNYSWYELCSNKFFMGSKSSDIFTLNQIITVMTIRMIDVHKWNDFKLSIKLRLLSNPEYLLISDILTIISSLLPVDKVFDMLNSLFDHAKLLDKKSLVSYRLKLIIRRLLVTHPTAMRRFCQRQENSINLVFEIIQETELVNFNTDIFIGYARDRRLTPDDCAFINCLCLSENRLVESLEVVELFDMIIKNISIRFDQKCVASLKNMIKHIHEPFRSNFITRLLKLQRLPKMHKSRLMLLLVDIIFLNNQNSQQIFDCIVSDIAFKNSCWLFIEDYITVAYTLVRNTKNDGYFASLIQKYPTLKTYLRCRLQNVPLHDEPWSKLGNFDQIINVSKISETIIIKKHEVKHGDLTLPNVPEDDPELQSIKINAFNLLKRINGLKRLNLEKKREIRIIFEKLENIINMK